MLRERLCAATRCPGAISVCNGFAPDFDLRFDKPSVDGSGKATIFARADFIVRGVVFQIPVEQVSALDVAEGVGNGYKRVSQFSVSTNDGAISAVTYIAGRTRQGLRPYDWYLQLVVAGARQNGLPEQYIAMLARVDSMLDPESQRPTRLEALRVLAEASSA